MRLLVIFNPLAGSKRAGKIIEEVRHYFIQKGIVADFKVTTHSWHGIDLVKESDLSAYDGVVAAGGDGTLFEVVNGYYQNTSLVKPPLGILPIGTGNAFCKELDLQSYEWQKAADIIGENNPKKIDIARLTSEGKTYYFINIMGIGWVADIGLTVDKMKGLGEVSYLAGVLYRLVFLKSNKMKLQFDDQRIERDTTFVEIANSRYTGATFIMAPEAKIDDGLLDIVLIKKVSRTKIVKLLPTIFTGKHVLDKDVEVHRAKKIRIESDVPKTLIADGEMFGSTPIEIECLPKAVSFFWM